MSSNDNTGTYDPALDDRVLTINEIMVRWKCTRKVILAAIKEKRLAAFRPGGRVFRVRFDEVVRFETEQKSAA
jgi:excisionase family DNA binding protein